MSAFSLLSTLEAFYTQHSPPAGGPSLCFGAAPRGAEQNWEVSSKPKGLKAPLAGRRVFLIRPGDHHA